MKRESNANSGSYKSGRKKNILETQKPLSLKVSIKLHGGHAWLNGHPNHRKNAHVIDKCHFLVRKTLESGHTVIHVINN